MRIFFILCIISVQAIAFHVDNQTSVISLVYVDPVNGGTSFNCAADGDCSNHGRCNNDTYSCHCDSGYVDYDCGYEQKEQLTAFFLHFFFGMPFGAGHFYIGDVIRGAGELALFWAGMISLGAGRYTKDGCIKALGMLSFTGSFVVWLLYDVLFGQNKITDTNGKPLANW